MTKQYALSQHFSANSPLVYGCMGLGGGWTQNPINKEDIAQAHQAIDTALESGISVFDHADIYTFGKAEQVFGEVLTQRPELREQIVLQSKCGIRFSEGNTPNRYDFSAEWITQSVDNILKRLQTEQLDVLMLHRPDPLMDAEKVAQVFEQLQQAGKVKHFGVSNMSAPQMSVLQASLKTPLVCNQLEISLSHLDWLEQNVVANCQGQAASNLVAGTLEYCQLNKVQVQAWGSLSQGLFTGKPADNNSLNAQIIAQTSALVQNLANLYQVSSEAIVLAFIMRHPAAIQPVIGSTNPARIRASAQASNITLSREHWYQLYVTARGNNLP